MEQQQQPDELLPPIVPTRTSSLWRWVNPDAAKNDDDDEVMLRSDPSVIEGSSSSTTTTDWLTYVDQLEEESA